MLHAAVLCKVMAIPRATSTSYVVLGLLSLRPWSAYELAQQSERTLRWVFPRAERAVYLEVKRLVRMGWATAEEEATGRRTRKVYSITEAGREALTAWMNDASEVNARVSSDVLLRIFLADQSPPGALGNAIRAVGDQAEVHLRRMVEMAATPSPFPERAATNLLALSFLAEVHAAIRSWAATAEQALAVIESGDHGAIAEQTERIAGRIAALGPPPSTSREPTAE